MKEIKQQRGKTSVLLWIFGIVLVISSCSTGNTSVQTNQDNVSNQHMATRNQAEENSGKPITTEQPKEEAIHTLSPSPTPDQKALRNQRILEKLNQNRDQTDIYTQEFLTFISSTYSEKIVDHIDEQIQGNTYNQWNWYEQTGKTIHVLYDEYLGKVKDEKSQKEHGIVVKEKKEEKFTFTFAGDINLAEGWSTTQTMDQRGGIQNCFSKELLQKMKATDIFLLNNEFTYSTKGTPLAGKDYTFRANPKRVSALQKLGVDIVSLANNHTYDYGEEALLDTLDTLQKAGIPYVGAGHNISEAMKPRYYIMNGQKIAIVAASQIERSRLFTKEATETSAGVLRTKTSEKFVKVIQEAKSQSDFVIAYVHWGTENTDRVDGTQRPLGKEFIDAGADFVIGAHPHCLQGIEYYNGKLIVYSLGNYWFNRRTLDTGLLDITFYKDGTQQVRFLPCIQRGGITSLLTSEKEKQRVIQYMESISIGGVILDKDGVIRKNK